MKLLLPENVYAEIFSFLLPDINKNDIAFTKSASISKELEEGKGDIALVPSMDLIDHPDFFVSGRTAISFDGPLSNSFFYFLKNIRTVKEIYMRGDLSKNEVILTKIIFKEQFDLDVQLFLDSHPFELNSKNYLVCGSENFNDGIFEVGLSLADQISDMIEAPYVNYILTSKDDALLKDFTSHLSNLDKTLEDIFDDISGKLHATPEATDHIKQNLNSVYYDMTEVEKKSLTDLVRLPYFTGIVEDINEYRIID